MKSRLEVSPTQRFEAMMKCARFILALVMGFGLCDAWLPANAQQWTLTGAPSLSWACVASSADGSRLIAGAGGKTPIPCYLSTNSGLSWKTNGLPLGSWFHVASSSDGAVLGCAESGSIAISTNAGATWTSNSLSGLTSIAISADGSKWVAVGLNHVYTSTNSGGAWSTNSVAGNWISVASSANGINLVMAGGTYTGPIYVSADAGATWTPTLAPSLDWAAVASSTDGVNLVAAASHSAYNAGAIFASTNSGGAWTITDASDAAWASLASSADGTKLIAGSLWDATAQATLRLYMSTNSGNHWFPSGSVATHWEGIASSAGGWKLAAAAGQYTFPGGIYTWVSPVPVLGVTRSDSNVMISWEVTPYTGGCVLQQNLDLTTTNWGPVSGNSVVTNGAYQVSVSTTNNQSFYRLSCAP